MATLQFVDSIASSPTLRLDINDGTNFNLFRDPDFSPPPLKRVRTATLMTDGDYIAATAYANRVIRLKLRAHGTSKDNLATNLQNLDRELDRKNNILKWQSTNATNPVFFRTFRSPEYKLEVGLNQSGDALNDVVVTLTIEAEPFAYGLRVTGSPVTVNNDPAHASNPCYFDVTGVTGDVPTPAFIQINPSSDIGATFQTLLAIRKHGTPGGVYIFQAEAMTQGTDTSVQVTDTLMSGASNNYSRTTFATATMQSRLTSSNFPASTSVDNRGSYRILVRLRASTGSPSINVRFEMNGVPGNSVAISGAIIQWVDLGVLAIPMGYADPVTEGYANTNQSVEPHTLAIQAERTTGAATIDWDAVMAVPADEELAFVKHVNSSGVELVLDGPNDQVYNRTVATGALYGLVTSGAMVERSGRIIELAPNQTNRICFLLNTKHTNAITDDKTWTASVTVSYWPRFLYIRP